MEGPTIPTRFRLPVSLAFAVMGAFFLLWAYRPPESVAHIRTGADLNPFGAAVGVGCCLVAWHLYRTRAQRGEQGEES